MITLRVHWPGLLFPRYLIITYSWDTEGLQLQERRLSSGCTLHKNSHEAAYQVLSHSQHKQPKWYDQAAWLDFSFSFSPRGNTGELLPQVDGAESRGLTSSWGFPESYSEWDSNPKSCFLLPRSVSHPVMLLLSAVLIGWRLGEQLQVPALPFIHCLGWGDGKSWLTCEPQVVPLQ